MKKKSVVFIEPRGNITNVFENYMKLPLVGCLSLGTILHNEGYDVKIINENILGREIDPFEISADVFCITSLTVAANRAKLLASQLKKIYPNSRVLMGGIHASLLCEEFMDVADQIVIGEGEDLIVDLIEERITEKVVTGNMVQDLNSLPLLNYRLLEGVEKLSVMPIMTSRGCPFDCNFCTVTKIFGKQFRMQDPARVVAEIENALKYTKIRDFFFYDDNFTANRRRMNELCDLIIEKDLRITWNAQVRSDLGKNPDLVKKMVKAGLNWVYIGFESVNDETLKAYHKSQTRADIEKAINTLHSFGVNIHGMFMFGEDHDRVEHLHDTVNFAINMQIDTVQFMILTPFPGTKVYEDLEMNGRMLHKNWDYFNGMFTVFRPKNMSAIKLQKETYKAYKRFYSMRRTMKETAGLIIKMFEDAFVWNFNNAHRYNLNSMLFRGVSKSIVTRSSPINEGYQSYLIETERKGVLKNI